MREVDRGHRVDIGCHEDSLVAVAVVAVVSVNRGSAGCAVAAAASGVTDIAR